MSKYEGLMYGWDLLSTIEELDWVDKLPEGNRIVVMPT